MDYVDGESLASYLSRVKRVPQAEAIDLALQIARGLEHAHQHNVIHRDIKPSNLMLAQDSAGKSVAKVVDFGLAQFISNDEANRLTVTGEVVGTPYYMSPEQATGEITDGRADVYSFGCVLYEMLSGAPPFTGENHLAVMTQHLHKAPPPLEPSLCSQSLNELVLRCLSKKADDRYKSFSEIVADLERVKRGEKIAVRPKAAVKVSWSAILVSFGLVMSLALFGAMAYFTVSKPTSGPSPADATLKAQDKVSAHEAELAALAAIRLMNEGEFDKARKEFETARSKVRPGSYELLRILENLQLIARLRHDVNEERKLRNEIEQVAQQAAAKVEMNHIALRERQATLELLPDKVPEKDQSKLIRLATDINDVARVLVEERHVAEAEGLLRLLIKKLQPNLPTTRQSLTSTYENLSRILELQNELAESYRSIEAAIALQLAAPEGSSTPLAKELAIRARLRAKIGELPQAQADIESVRKMIHGIADAASKKKLETDLNYALAEVSWQRGESDYALKLLDNCRTQYNLLGEINLARSALDRELTILQFLNQVPRAEKLLLGVIEETKRARPFSLDLAESQELLGDLYYRQPSVAGKTNLAIKYLEECMVIRQLCLPPDDALVNESILHFAAAAGSVAQPLLDRIVVIRQMDKREDSTYVRAILLSSYFSRTWDPDKSKQLFQKAFEIILHRADADLIDQRFFELAFSSWPRDSRNWQLAEELLVKLETAAEKKHGPNSIERAKSIESRGLLFFARKDFEHALEYLQEARKVALAAIKKEFTPATCWQAANIINNLARVSSCAGKPDWMKLVNESESIRYEAGKKTQN